MKPLMNMPFSQKNFTGNGFDFSKIICHIIILPKNKEINLFLQNKPKKGLSQMPKLEHLRQLFSVFLFGREKNPSRG
ncbi:MAG: hypothetical protein E7603_09120 [Ruminococcaceae bacterium]|nr:hypothetical protein [Oscillospiraceae bacterium]